MPGAAMLEGAKVAVTPGGIPLAASDTAELNPVPPAVVRVTAVEAPGARLRLMLGAVSVNVGVKTVRPRASVLVTPPPVPVTVKE